MYQPDAWTRTPPPPRPQRSATTILLVVLLAVMLVWVYREVGANLLGARNAVPRAVTARGDLADDEKDTISIFQNASRSTVYVSTAEVVHRGFMGLDESAVRGTGSGFVWDTDGHIVTNNHVIEHASSCRVTLYDNTSYDAELVGTTADKDIAVLHINAPASALVPIPVGTSHDLKVGQKVFAIGNPFGLDYTLTTGVVSALNRDIQSSTGRTIQDVIQTDAAINPGNSGGPLLDSAGRLIGMNTAIFSPSGASAGIGFAIPVDTVNRIVPQIIAHGRVTRPGLGVNLIPDAYLARMGIEGVGILTVQPGSAAEQAGLRGVDERHGAVYLGDVILAVDGKPTPNANALFNVLEKHDVGDTVNLTVLRDEKRVTVSVKLQAVAPAT